MEWQEIAVKTTGELVETVSDIFYDLGAGGVVIEDPKVYTSYIEGGKWDYHDIPDELLKREFVVVKGYLPVNEELLLKKEELANRLAEIGRLFPCTLLEVSFLNSHEEDWAHSWKAYYKPLKIATIVIKPTWENYQLQEEEIVIELDPGMAFGTGTHPTTVMVLEFLQDLVSENDVVADVGTGTGVLAVAAAKLGANKVYAMDIDAVAIDAAQENVVNNHVQGLVEVFKNDLLEGFDQKVTLISANIVADIIIKMFTQVKEVLLPGGYMIASGIIKERLQDVLEAAAVHNLQVEAQKFSGEWVAVCIKR